MAYYWVTEAQKYIQSLGFGITLPPDQHGVAGYPHQPVGQSTTRTRGTSTTCCASARAAWTTPKMPR